jgi:hypothetical protein
MKGAEENRGAGRERGGLGGVERAREGWRWERICGHNTGLRHAERVFCEIPIEEVQIQGPSQETK